MSIVQAPIVLIWDPIDQGGAGGHSQFLTCKELRVADTFKTFTDSTGKSFLSIRGMLFLSRHKLHPNPGQTYLRNQSDMTCFTQAASKASRVVGVRGGFCWWEVMMADRVKKEDSCRSENRSLRPPLPLLSCPTNFPSLGHGHSMGH